MTAQAPVVRFRKQDEAFKYVDEKTEEEEEMFVFSFELQWKSKKFSGCRAFLVSSVASMYDLIVSRAPPQRRYYELIRENAHCKLYFDLEFCKISNPHISFGDLLTLDFIEFVINLLVDQQLPVSMDDFLVLNSETDTKYSSHVILNSPDFCFENNVILKEFVQLLMLQPSSKMFNCFDQHGKTNLFCDLSVYSKNRNFRMFLNTKFNKDSYLRVSDIDAFVLSKGGLDDKEIFLYSLVTYFHNSKDNMKVICQEHITRIKKSQKNSTPCDVELELTQIMSNLKIDKPISRTIDSSGDKMVYYYKSPFHDLDDAITAIISRHNGHIYCISKFKKSAKITYNFRGYRYCEKRRRNHKSNGVYFIVDVSLGGYWQRCFDVQDCRNFESEFHRLDDNVILSTREIVERLDKEQAQGVENVSDQTCNVLE